MRRAIVVALGTGAVITSAAAIGIGIADDAPQSLSPEQYRASLLAIDGSRQRALGGCETLAEGQRESCRALAAAEGALRVAELDNAHRRDNASARALQRARIESRYAIDRSQCAGLSGFKRDKCLVRAHATRGRAMLEAAAPYEVRYTP